MEQKILKVDLTSMDDILERISVKKSNITDQQTINNLKKVCESVKSGNIKDIERVLCARLALLNSVSEICVEEDEEKGFELAMEEIEILEGLMMIKSSE